MRGLATVGFRNVKELDSLLFMIAPAASCSSTRGAQPDQRTDRHGRALETIAARFNLEVLWYTAEWLVQKALAHQMFKTIFLASDASSCGSNSVAFATNGYMDAFMKIRHQESLVRAIVETHF
jgi:hypothetical protein